MILFSDGEALELLGAAQASFMLELHNANGATWTPLSLLYNWDGPITLIKQSFYLSLTSSHALSR